MEKTYDEEVVSIIQEEAGQSSDDKNVVSITEAAKINNVTRQAIYVAIKQKKLRATKKTRWEIDLKDLEEYRKNKYSRSKSMFAGELLFDNDKGYYSVNQVARLLGVPAQKVYYASRTGKLTGFRKGAAWVFQKQDVEKYKEDFLEKKQSRRKAV